VDNSFGVGDTVIFDTTKINPECWDGWTETTRIKYYGRYGYGSKLKLFTFITYHYPQLGHCVLMDMDDGKLLPMCHDSDFRLVTDEEC
jgi:hypothetical protein